MSFDYSKLCISPTSLSEKLNNKSDFSHGEIVLACEKLGIPISAVSDYFFCVGS